MKKSLIIVAALAALSLAASAQATSTMAIASAGTDSNYALANKVPAGEGSGIAVAPEGITKLNTSFGNGGGSSCIRSEGLDLITACHGGGSGGITAARYPDGDGIKAEGWDGISKLKTVFKTTAPPRDLDPISI